MYFALHNIRSAWNVGAIFRTADALKAGVILCGYTAKPLGKSLTMIRKTALGAEANVKWMKVDTPLEALAALPAYRHFGIELTEQSVDAFTYFGKNFTERNEKDAVLWLGNEISGLEAGVLKHFEATLHLPMLGQKESLNVASTACTVGYLYHYLATNGEKNI